MNSKSVLVAGVLLAFTAATPVLAAKCSNSGAGFDAFKRDFAKEAKAAGIGRKGLRALASTKYSPGVIKFDRRVNRSFKRAKTNFNKFYATKTRGLKAPTNLD